MLLNGREALHWALAGGAIAIITCALLFLTNRRLGVSTGFENVCAIVSDAPYFLRDALHGKGRWRLSFLAGLVVGGLLSSVLAGTWLPTWHLGMFETTVGSGKGLKVAWMFAGGLFIGFGTRLAGGCTSGHGIFGNANLEKASIKSTVAFMAAGIVTTNVVYRLIGGA